VTVPINLLNLTPSANAAHSGARNVSAARQAERSAELKLQRAAADDRRAPKSDRSERPDRNRTHETVAHAPAKPNDKAGHAHGQDPFVAILKQTVALLRKVSEADKAPATPAEADKAPATAAEADKAQATPSATQSVACDVNPEAALALLAQFAALFPGVNPQGVAAAGDTATTGQAALTLDPQLLQKLFGQPGQPGDVPTNLLSPGHMALGVPLSSAFADQLQHLQADVQALEQRLAAMMAQSGQSQPVLVAKDLESPTVMNLTAGDDKKSQAAADALTEAMDLAAGATKLVPAAIVPTAMLVPPVNVAATPDAATSHKGASALSAQTASASDPRSAAIDMLLKPMRGELHVENGGDGTGAYALKGMRTDAAFTVPTDGTDPMQQLVETGKNVAMALPEGETTLASALGITIPGKDGTPVAPMAGPGLVITPAVAGALSAAPVEPVAAALSDADKADDAADDTLKSDGPRAEELNVSLATLHSAHGSEAATGVGEGPRAQQAVMQQVIDTIKELAPGPAQVRMVLNPESLGQITVRLVSHQGQVSVRVLTENPDVQKMLDGGIGHLKAALAESGVRLENIQVVTVPAQSEQRPDGQPQHRQHQSQAEHKGRAPRDEATAEELAALERLNALADGHGS
jgi:hypothetical protein